MRAIVRTWVKFVAELVLQFGVTASRELYVQRCGLTKPTLAPKFSVGSR